MISYLKGAFVNKTPSSVIIDINGLGYEVNISLNTYSKIQSQESGLLYIHLLIKEDAHLLYGFADPREKDVFLGLISVSGIGAGTARLMLSYMKPEEIIAGISQGDSKSLERIKGIGKKTAERTVLELRDKIGKLSQDPVTSLEKNNSIKENAFEALSALGINKTHAEQALHKALYADPNIDLESLIKKVLKEI